MSELAGLSDLQFEVPPTPAANIGARGSLKWIGIDKLMVDQSYQRPVDAAGKKNIRRILMTCTDKPVISQTGILTRGGAA